MQTATLEFSHNARTTYTAVKNLFRKRTKFGNVKTDDDLFTIEARHGAWISPFSENVKMKVVATSSRTCKVVIESSSRSWLNLFNFGANKGSISDLSDYISNEVYKLMQPGEIPMTYQDNDHSTIRGVLLITPVKFYIPTECPFVIFRLLSGPFCKFHQSLCPHFIRPQQEHLFRSLPTERHLVALLYGRYLLKLTNCSQIKSQNLTKLINRTPHKNYQARDKDKIKYHGMHR